MSAEFTVMTRYRVASPDTWLGEARAALAPLAGSNECMGADICASIDDPHLFAIVTRWPSVGAYRRAMSAFDVKMFTVPLLSSSLDEPTTYEILHHRGPDGDFDIASARAADADLVALGETDAAEVRARLHGS